MKLPLQITFHGLDSSEAVSQAIREKVLKLEQKYDRITGCRVAVEAPHRHKAKGIQYRVRIDVTVPGDELVVARDPDIDAHEDIYVAIRDAFRSMRSQLEHWLGRRRETEKAGNERVTGQIQTP
jgi:ribosome-associated translation inhibitor RaiA